MSTTELIELIKLIEVQGQEKLKQKMASNTRVSFKKIFMSVFWNVRIY